MAKSSAASEETKPASKSGSDTSNKSKRERARDVLHDYADTLLDDYSEITAMDIGYREKGDVEQKDGDVCLLIWVEKKLPKSKLKETGRRCLPPVYEGIAVDVREGQAMFVMADKEPKKQCALEKNKQAVPDPPQHIINGSDCGGEHNVIPNLANPGPMQCPRENEEKRQGEHDIIEPDPPQHREHSGADHGGEHFPNAANHGPVQRPREQRPEEHGHTVLRSGDLLTLWRKETHGTLSCFATDRNGKVGIIGCYHTLKPDTRVVVPFDGREYDNTGQDHVERDVVANVVVPEYTGYSQSVDSAFAIIDQPDAIQWDFWIASDIDLRGKINREQLQRRLEDEEKIPARYRGNISGLVSSTLVKARPWYIIEGRRFHNQLCLSGPPADGDSGALVVVEDGPSGDRRWKAAGIIIARFCERIQSYAIANPIDDVENFLGVTLLVSDN